MQSVYGPESKRRKTEAEKAADAEKKKARESAMETDPLEAWELGQRQPWAEKAVKSAKPTEEQLEWLKAEGFIEEVEEGAEQVSIPTCYVVVIACPHCSQHKKAAQSLAST